jgi:hypothetical protein
MEKIVEVQGAYVVTLENGPKLFMTYQAAQDALIEFEKGSEHRDLADLFCETKGYTGKAAVGKKNIIMEFLAFTDTLVLEGSPETYEEVRDEEFEEDF